MKRVIVTVICSVMVAAVAAAAPRSLIVPPAGADVGEIALGSGAQVIEQYPNALWVEGDAETARAHGAFVKTWDDWDVIRTVRPFRIGQMDGVNVAAQPGFVSKNWWAVLGLNQ